MPYERKSLQILSPGLNLLPPGDKVPIGEQLIAQNWRSDTLGKLVSRAGYLQQISFAGAGIAHSAGCAGMPWESGYYFACNSDIHSPSSAVYWDGISAPIAAGFDGNRVGFAFQNGYAYIMNRGNQGRHSDLGGFEPWNLSGPGSAPPSNPTASTSGSTPPFQFNVTYTYNKNADPTYVHFLSIAGVVYSLTDNGYGAEQIPYVLSLLAANDTNCLVTYSGTGQQLYIQAVIPSTLIAVHGSDGNPPVSLLNGTASSLPVGTYTYYYTYLSSDQAVESNPSGPSNPTTTSTGGQSNDVTFAAPTDPRIGFVNIYRSGGTQSAIYRVASIAWPTTPPGTTTMTDSLSDLAATNIGVTMPTTNGAPPSVPLTGGGFTYAAGLIGPFLGRLYAWSTTANPNRLFYTPANLPQYWNADPQVGDWIDVGLDKEAIVWCTIHSNLLVIYKERSIWILIGDPLTGQLEQAYDGFGLVSAFALAPAGQIDYFVGPGSLCVFDMSQVHQITGNVLPLFTQSLTNNGPLTSPGSVLPGSAFNSRNANSPYAIALGHAMGRLYVGYAEQSVSGTSYNLLVFEEGPSPERSASEYLTSQRSGKWFYHRNTVSPLGFFGFFFDGANMLGLTGTVGGAAVGLSLADYRTFSTTDVGGAAIECVYQSHYEDCGHPDNDKMFLEIAIDFYFASGANANVYVGFNNGVVAPAIIGNLTPGARRTVSFPFSATDFPEMQDAGVLARNISILIDVGTTGLAIIHNVYVFYYVEARLAVVASTLPTDLGVGKNKQCKELELDIAAPNGTVNVAVVSDLPGNALATARSPTVAQGPRALWKYPFNIAEGYLWQVALTAAGGAPFRLYGVRLLMRVLGVYVEPYESLAGFVWDSMQVDLGDPDAKTLDQLRFELDTDPGTGTVHAQLFTDLPGEAFASRGTFELVSQTALTPRAWVTVPLPDPLVPTPGAAIEARSIRVQTTGTVGYRLYTVQARYRKIGRYLVGATVSGYDDAFDVLAYDYRTERRKMFKRIEIDIHADGTVTMQTITDQDSGAPPAVVLTSTITTPGGREAVLVQLPPGLRGRLMRVRLTSDQPARIYNIRVWTRTVDDPKGAWMWEDFPLEPSDILPHWANLLIDETPPKWQWVDIPFDVVDS